MNNHWEILEKDLLRTKRLYQFARWIISPGLALAGWLWLSCLPSGTNIESDPRGVGIGLAMIIAGVILWGVFHHLTLQYSYRYWQCIRWQRGQDSDPEKFWSNDGYAKAFYKW